MDEEQAKQANQSNSGCSFKSLFKCCLFYYTALIILALIFTGANNEPKDATQIKWWWAFIISLLATGSLAATALAILIYTDHYRPTTEEDAPPEPGSGRLRQSRRMPGHDTPDSVKTIVPGPGPIPKPKNNPPVESYLGKTLRDDGAMMETSNRLPVVQGEAAPESSQTGFVNMTPDAAKSPVTVVDMTLGRNNPPADGPNRILPAQSPAKPNRNRIEQPSNLASVISNPIQDDNNTMNKNNRRRRRRGRKRKDPGPG